MTYLYFVRERITPEGSEPVALYRTNAAAGWFLDRRTGAWMRSAHVRMAVSWDVDVRAISTVAAEVVAHRWGHKLTQKDVD